MGTIFYDPNRTLLLILRSAETHAALAAAADGVLVSPSELALPTAQELEATRQRYFERILGPTADSSGTAA